MKSIRANEYPSEDFAASIKTKASDLCSQADLGAKAFEQFLADITDKIKSRSL